MALENSKMSQRGKKYLTLYGNQNIIIMVTKAAIDESAEQTIYEAM
jgi:hypothetical protein